MELSIHRSTLFQVRSIRITFITTRSYGDDLVSSVEPVERKTHYTLQRTMMTSIALVKENILSTFNQLESCLKTSLIRFLSASTLSTIRYDQIDKVVLFSHLEILGQKSISLLIYDIAGVKGSELQVNISELKRKDCTLLQAF